MFDPLSPDKHACPSLHAHHVRLVRLQIRSRSVRLRLYLGGANRAGSLKAHTAYALLKSLEDSGRIRVGGHVVESTSGNLGVALAILCAERGYRCTLVVDETVSSFTARRMTQLGAELVCVRPPESTCAVAARVARVGEILVSDPTAVWTDQYTNPAAPAIHQKWTGPNLLHCGELPHPQVVMVPVSTGGTLAGVAAYVRAHSPDVRIGGVDAVGSAATGGAASPRYQKLPGFGSGLRSTYLSRSDTDFIAMVSDADAAHACRTVQAQIGLSLGGSSGATILAAVRAALQDNSLNDIACLSPDGGEGYRSTIYAPSLVLHPPARPLGSALALGALRRLHEVSL